MVDRSAEKGSAIERVIATCARNPVLTLISVAAIGLWGYYSLSEISLDAIPDLSDTQVIVFTEWPGRSPDLVEDQVTYPISAALLAAPRVRFVRGQSFMGLSFVYIVFEDGTDMYWARSRVLEYLNSAQGRLPDDAVPRLGPDATGVGWVFQYALVDRTGQHDLADLRSVQDWYVRYWLESVEGVAEVAAIGGFVREYQVEIDPNRLLAHGVSIGEVAAAIRRSNQDVGGRVLEISGHEYFVRGRGYIQSLEDLEEVPLKVSEGGVPVLLRDVAKIQFGPEMRRGVAELNGEGEVVGGIVVMRYGENALRVIDAVKERIAETRASLPEGIELVVTYDRSELILRAIGTLRSTLIQEMIVVSLVITVFLLHFRSALVAVITLPLAVLLSFIPMYYQGITANIMSLGGIAVAIGAMVDASIILIENVHQKLQERERDDGTPATGEGRVRLVIDAMQEVGPTIFVSLLIITVSFLPVFSLSGASGRLFAPLALSKTYSMGFAAVLAITLTPALVVLFIRGGPSAAGQGTLNHWLVAIYIPVVRWVVRRRYWVTVVALVMTLVSVPVFFRLGHEFMPHLNEGSILYMPTTLPGMSIGEATAVLQSMDREIRSFPEVETVFGKMGRAETATDPAPLSMAETVITLKPESEWRPGVTWDSLIAEMDEKLQFPGMPNIWWMPIETRTEMLTTGIRSALGIKVYGPDLATIEATGIEIERALQEDERTAPATRSAFAERLTGGYFIDFEIDRAAAARHGLTVGDIEDVIASAIGGMQVGTTIEGRERYPISLRYAQDFRGDLEALKRILIPIAPGIAKGQGASKIPISQVASLELSTGPPMIRSESGQFVGFVLVDVSERGIADYVADARGVVADRVALPPGVRLEWAGQFTHYERSRQRLLLVVPMTLFIVCLLLYLQTRSGVETLLVLLALPFSLIGAVWLLYLLDFNLSVAVWVGAIALAGLDAETGVIMLLYLRLAHDKWEEGTRQQGLARDFRGLEDAIVEGAAKRIRPKLMAVVTTFVGLLPVMWSTGTGAEVMQRIAAPMVGGLLTSFLLQLTVYPALFAIWKERALDANQPTAAISPP